MLITIPPLPEQKRIVAKVDELMERCDELEARQTERSESRTALTASCLHAVTSTPRKTAAPAIDRALQNFSLLIDTPESVAELRQNILQLAVQGWLTGSGGSARVVDFEEIIKETRYGTAKKCHYSDKGTPVLRIPNVVGGRIVLDDLKHTELAERELAALSLKTNDLLLVRSNGSVSLVGRAAVVTRECEGFAYAGYLVRVRIHPELAESPFVQLALSTASVRNQVERPIRTTSGVKNINTQEIKALSFPLPPLPEQKRIVAKVNELMDLCDALEARLTQSREDADALVATVVHHLCNGGARHAKEATP